MEIKTYQPVPSEYYDSLNYPKEGKCSDIIFISNSEADEYYNAALECFKVIDRATEWVIKNKKLGDIGIPEYMWNIIERTYNDFEHHPHMIGRFDFAGGLDGKPIKLIEFNADTPFSIFEVSTVQYALAKYHNLNPDEKQFNTLFEQLGEFFKFFVEKHSDIKAAFVNAADGEDDLNTQIIQEASLPYINSKYIHWTDLCIDANYGLCTTDKEESGEYIDDVFNTIFKMVPWDLLITEDPIMCKNIVNLMERNPDITICNPPYALCYQSKKILEVAYMLDPMNKYLLRTSSYPLSGIKCVTKPNFGREGANIKIYSENQTVEEQTDGFYTDQPVVYQEKAELNYHDGYYYQAGVFVSMEEPCGLGFRRSRNQIITTDDEMVGHIIK